MRYAGIIRTGVLIVGLLALIALGLIDVRMYIIVHAVRQDILH